MAWMFAGKARKSEKPFPAKFCRTLGDESSPGIVATRTATLAWSVLAILVVAVSLFAYFTRECFVDDAFIGFQYIENLLAGHGFVFHPGQPPVEGVTNIGWLLFLAPVGCCWADIAAKGVGLALLLAAIAITMFSAKVWPRG